MKVEPSEAGWTSGTVVVNRTLPASCYDQSCSAQGASSPNCSTMVVMYDCSLQRSLLFWSHQDHSIHDPDWGTGNHELRFTEGESISLFPVCKTNCNNLFPKL